MFLREHVVHDFALRNTDQGKNHGLKDVRRRTEIELHVGFVGEAEAESVILALHFILAARHVLAGFGQIFV